MRIKKGFFVEAAHALYSGVCVFGVFKDKEQAQCSKSWRKVFPEAEDVEVIERDYILINNESFVLEKVFPIN